MSFKNDVINGLTSQPKTLPSKYFYDERGSVLFQSIMKLPEYYLTGAEMEILKEQSDDIWSAWESEHNATKARVIELGAGDGLKTRLLLEAGLQRGLEIHYTPIDISANVFEDLEKNIPDGVFFEPIHGDFFQGLSEMAQIEGIPSIVLFLGSNIGNMPYDQARDFLTRIRKMINSNDRLLLGVDHIKSPNMIRRAYNDAAGVTAAFNHNLLFRINRELNANFDPDYFEHYASFVPETGEARSYLISKREQSITIAEHTIHFDQWEYIHMEVSKKYSINELNELLEQSGFESAHRFRDCKHYFIDDYAKPI